MRKIILIFLITLTNFSYSQSKYDEKIVELVCDTSKTDSIYILGKLSLESNSFRNPITIETLKKVYIRQLSEDRERVLQMSKTDPGVIKSMDFLLNSSKSSYKYALCEKYKRREASVETISSEAYFLCRESISTEKEQRPKPCF